ncbi:unnamed protein product [Linum trigynum]|uniref:Uncharacterized protein n=1 Tax=Linum trigynum TaxID=586398 RepID=A0AAV2CZ50_9ROSI
MALPCPAMGSDGLVFRTQSGVFDITDSAISVADPRCQRKNKKEKKYSAPPVQPTTSKNAKQISANWDRRRVNSEVKVLPPSNSDVIAVAESGRNLPPESSLEKEEEKIDGGRRIPGLAMEEAGSGGTASLPRKATSGFVMDDRRRRLVEMAKRYLRKHRRSDDACYGGGDGDDESPTKRQRLGN